MGSMSYCLFENTYRDLQRCMDKLDETPIEELSDDECKFRGYLIDLCQQIADEHGDDDD